MNGLGKSILATLVYYDVLDRPLTSWEIFAHLIKSKEKEEEYQGKTVKLSEILYHLENNLELKNNIEQKNGFYFLKGRKNIIRERINRQKIADEKWKKARKMIKMLQMIPFIKMVIVSGSLAINNPKEESDIDLLIITKKGRIWTCRILVTLFTQLIGWRRHGLLTKNRLCLNHYLTEKSLEIPFKSLYNAQTYSHFVSLWEARPCELRKKIQKQNSWLNNYLFFGFRGGNYLNQIKSNKSLSAIRKTGEFLLNRKIGDMFEIFLKKVQSERINKDPLTYQSGGRVVVNNKQLEFHPSSPEKKILEKYNQKMKKLGMVNWSHEKDSGLIA